MSQRVGLVSLFGITAGLLALVGVVTALAAPSYNAAQKPVKTDYTAIASQVVDQHKGDVGSLEEILRASGVEFESDFGGDDVKRRFNLPKLLAEYCLGAQSVSNPGRAEANAACQTYSQLVAQAGQLQSPK